MTAATALISSRYQVSAIVSGTMTASTVQMSELPTTPATAPSETTAISVSGSVATATVRMYAPSGSIWRKSLAATAGPIIASGATIAKHSTPKLTTQVHHATTPRVGATPLSFWWIRTPTPTSVARKKKTRSRANTSGSTGRAFV